MEKAVSDRKSFIVNFVYFGIIIGLYYFVVKFAFGYIFPFVFAAVLAIFLQKPVRFISSKLKLKAHGAISTIMVLLIVVAVVGVIALAVNALIGELKDFISYFLSRFKSVDDLLKTIEESLLNIVVALPKGVGVTLADKITQLFDNFSVENTGIDMGMITAPLSGAWGVVKGVPSFLVSIVVTIVSCVFMTSEYDLVRDMILSILPEKKGKNLARAKNTVTQGIGKLIKAYATIMFITFCEVFLGLNLMRLIGVYDGGYIATIAFVICIVDIIPVLGTGTIVIPWAIYSIITGNFALGIALIALYAIITVLRQIIEPKLVANQVGLPSIVTIMAMFLGGRIFGAFGILLLPLTVIIVKLMYDDGVIGAKSHSASAEVSEDAG